MLDLSGAWQVKSDRLNADDIVGITPTVTVRAVDWPKGGQPRIHLDQYPERPYIPSAGMGRVMREVWGSDGEAWVGRRLTLFNKPDVEFNKERTGGIRILAMSHMDRARTFEVKEKRGLRVPYEIQPLPDEPPAEPATEPWQAQWQAISNALTAAGYEGDGPALLTTAGQVIGAEWTHPNQITAEAAQKVLAAVREDNNEEN